jgi:hypothetical protein
LKKNSIEAEQIVKTIVALIAQIIITDPLWKIFGFEKCPKRGRIFNKFVNDEKLAQENYIMQQSIALAISHVLYIFKRELLDELQYAIFCGVLQKLTEKSLVMSSRFENSESAISYYEKYILEYLSHSKDSWGEIYIRNYPSDKLEAKLMLMGVFISNPATSPFLNLEFGVHNLIREYEIIGNVKIDDGPESKIIVSVQKILGYYWNLI